MEIGSFRIRFRYRGSFILRLITFYFFSAVDLGQAAFAGFPEPMVQIHTGFLHGPADHIIADIPGAGEEIAQVAGIHGTDGGYSVALDAGNLDKSADGVAGEA